MAATALFSAATALLGKSSPLANYIVSDPSSSSSSGAGSSSSTPTAGSSSDPQPFAVGLWRVVPARHRTTGQAVSVWVCEKRVLDGVRDPARRQWVVEQMKKEVSSLTRLRHPHLLHIIEPLEETRLALTWASERVVSSLGGMVSAAEDSPRRRPAGAGAGPGAGKAGRVLGTEGEEGEGLNGMEIDEVEVQKGTIQLAQALSFLHNQAKLVHLNVTPEAILINATGDWKLSGLHLAQPLSVGQRGPDGEPIKYVYPEVDRGVPPSVQWNLDYLAPEYALDATTSPANDLYSIGCILYTLHVARHPPFRNNSSMSSLRTHADDLARPAATWATGRAWQAASNEVRDLLPRLLTRHPQSRLSLAGLPQHPYFSSLAISTLNFLDPSTFASKPREEKATFLKGLLRVLPGFSERLRKRKVLPALLEEMKDNYLIPFILPLVFSISSSLAKEEFQPVLTKLQPLFAMKDPPQIMMTLLESLPLLEAKTSQTQFRDSVMPLIYNSLDSDHPPVQEKALEGVPKLCSALDYGTVENVLLVKVAILFTKTRILSVKVKTLECFLQMVPILDKSVLTTKLVPLLAKIKTKEPAVMMATLAVHEAMGARVDRSATATLVLPQLWAMSMGSPLLNVDQFSRFMTVIKTLGARVEREHFEHLRAARQLEDQTAHLSLSIDGGSNGFAAGLGSSGGEVDFETLVNGGRSNGHANRVVPSAPLDPWAAADGWEDNWTIDSAPTPVVAAAPAQPAYTPSPRANSSTSSPARLKARTVPASSFNASAFPPPQPIQPLAPQPAPQSRPPAQTRSSGPNYNLSLSPQAPTTPAYPSAFPTLAQPTYTPPAQSIMQPAFAAMQPQQPARTNGAPPPGWNPAGGTGVLQPTLRPAFNPQAASKVDWSDFDPLK